MNTAQKPCQDMDLTQFELSKITLRNLKNFDLTATEKLVLLSLVDHYPKIFPSQQTIADELGIGLRSVCNAIKTLRKQGIIIYETKKHNTYKLTRAFFGVIDVQNSTKTCAKIAHKEIKEEINKKSSFNQFGSRTNVKQFSQKRKDYRSNCHIEGPKYQEFKPEKVKASSPMDMSKAQAMEFIENMPPEIRKKSIFAKELQKKFNL